MTTKPVKKTSIEDHLLASLLDDSYPLWTEFESAAPGTARHSKEVAALCKKVANKLGDIDPVLMEVLGRWHDVGKARNPKFFVENQMPGEPNIHDELDNPLYSFHIISQHVGQSTNILIHLEDLVAEDLLNLVKIISQHHGSTTTKYFLSKAQEANPNLDINTFRYYGSAPTTKEAALLMICDVFEAKGRAAFGGKTDPPEPEEFVGALLDELVSESQLDVLQVRDIREARELLIAELLSIYHDRIKYPAKEEK